ncbi:hypothetical protein NE865_00944 [Phthorimaea operculella]|nr:hypothetical protein NE865_00944 [Phthorimaea operculella]
MLESIRVKGIALYKTEVYLSSGLKCFSESYIAPMKEEFNEKLNKLMQRKKSNSINFMTRDRYEQFIQEIWELKNKRYKEFDDFKMLASYDVLEMNGKMRLITPKDDNGAVKFYVTTDELFGVLHTMHLLFDHANKEVMEREIKTKYCNVSKEVIRLYLMCCETCKQKA